MLASLVVLLRFACFICLVFMVWLPVLLWFALFACLVWFAWLCLICLSLLRLLAFPGCHIRGLTWLRCSLARLFSIWATFKLFFWKRHFFLFFLFIYWAWFFWKKQRLPVFGWLTSFAWLGFLELLGLLGWLAKLACSLVLDFEQL